MGKNGLVREREKETKYHLPPFSSAAHASNCAKPSSQAVACGSQMMPAASSRAIRPSASLWRRYAWL